MSASHIPPELLERLQQQAQRHSQTTGEYLENLLDQHNSVEKQSVLLNFTDERLLKQFLDMLPIGAVCVDRHHNITCANHHISDLFGYSPDELRGELVNVLIPDYLQHHGQHIDSFFANPTSRIIGNRDNLQGKRKDGSTFHIELGLNAINTIDGVHAIAFISNAQKYKTIEKLLLKNQAAFKRAQAQAHVGSWSVNLTTDETFWSDEFFRICGLKPGSIKPSTEARFALIHPDDRAKATADLKRTREEGVPYNVEKRIIRPDDTIRWVKSQGEIIFDTDTNEPILLGTFIDITDMKEAEQDRLKLEMEQQRVKMLNDFMQNAAHEFRTPLSIIRSSLFLLRRYDDPEKRLHKADIIEDQIQNIITLVDSLSLIVRLETITQPGNHTRQQSIKYLIESALDRLKAKGYQQAIRLEHHCLKCSVMTHDNDLELAILHVLDNACRFSQPDSIVHISTNCEEEQAIIRVRDEGVGIADEELSKIFETFWRKDTAHSTPGFGLGLPIARRIIERHGGKIEINSGLKQGTEVCLYIPLSGEKCSSD